MKSQNRSSAVMQQRSEATDSLDDEPEMLDFALIGRFEPMVDLIVGNPPFNLAEEFISNGINRSRVGVAMLVRRAFIEGEGRYARLFSKRPPDYELHFVERV